MPILGRDDAKRIAAEFSYFEGAVLEKDGRSHYGKLVPRIVASGLDFLTIGDALGEECLHALQKRVESTTDRMGRGVLHYIAKYPASPHHDSAFVLKMLLALGLNPDLPDNLGGRPSHYCSNSFKQRPVLARILSNCRPDLSAKNGTGQTPLDVVEMGRKKSRTNFTWRMSAFNEIGQTWTKCKEEGFTPLPQLAANQEWYAVQNLCRRRAVDRDEVLLTDQGLNVVQWALRHGQECLAAEICYLFDLPDSRNLVAPSLPSLEEPEAREGSIATPAHPNTSTLGTPAEAEIKDKNSFWTSRHPIRESEEVDDDETQGLSVKSENGDTVRETTMDPSVSKNVENEGAQADIDPGGRILKVVLRRLPQLTVPTTEVDEIQETPDEEDDVKLLHEVDLDDVVPPEEEIQQPAPTEIGEGDQGLIVADGEVPSEADVEVKCIKEVVRVRGTRTCSNLLDEADVPELSGSSVGGSATPGDQKDPILKAIDYLCDGIMSEAFTCRKFHILRRLTSIVEKLEE